MPVKHLLSIFVALLLLCGNALAANDSYQRKELVVRQIEPIEFGAFASGQGGSLTIDAVSGGHTSGGDVAVTGARYGQAEFEISGQPAEEITVDLPPKIMLESTSGGASLALTRLTAHPSGIIKLDERGQARIKVGGTLMVPGKLTRGKYNGFFSLNVRYIR